MKIWSTLIYAKCAVTGEMKTFGGPNIPAPTQKLAHEYCQKNGLGYCHIGDEVICEIPCKPGGFEPDFYNGLDFENVQNN